MLHTAVWAMAFAASLCWLALVAVYVLSGSG